MQRAFATSEGLGKDGSVNLRDNEALQKQLVNIVTVIKNWLDAQRQHRK